MIGLALDTHHIDLTAKLDSIFSHFSQAHTLGHVGSQLLLELLDLGKLCVHLESEDLIIASIYLVS